MSRFKPRQIQIKAKNDQANAFRETQYGNNSGSGKWFPFKNMNTKNDDTMYLRFLHFDEATYEALGLKQFPAIDVRALYFELPNYFQQEDGTFKPLKTSHVFKDAYNMGGSYEINFNSDQFNVFLADWVATRKEIVENPDEYMPQEVVKATAELEAYNDKFCYEKGRGDFNAIDHYPVNQVGDHRVWTVCVELEEDIIAGCSILKKDTNAFIFACKKSFMAKLIGRDSKKNPVVGILQSDKAVTLTEQFEKDQVANDFYYPYTNPFDVKYYRAGAASYDCEIRGNCVENTTSIVHWSVKDELIAIQKRIDSASSQDVQELENELYAIIEKGEDMVLDLIADQDPPLSGIGELERGYQPDNVKKAFLAEMEAATGVSPEANTTSNGTANADQQGDGESRTNSFLEKRKAARGGRGGRGQKTTTTKEEPQEEEEEVVTAGGEETSQQEAPPKRRTGSRFSRGGRKLQ